MQNIIEKIHEMVKTADMSQDTVERLVAMAYWHGREQATQEIIDEHNAIIGGMRERAEGCRYHNMAAEIIGQHAGIYSDDYAGDMTKTFGQENTNF